MKFVSFLLVIFLVPPVFASEDQPQVEFDRSYSCDQANLRGVRFNYCLRKTSRQNTKDIVYYFHGSGGNADQWFRLYFMTMAMQRRWTYQGYDPMVITISFGPDWALIDNDRYKLLSYFKNVAVPFLENKVGGLQKGKRKLIGLSMGGYNAIQVGLREPRMFTRIALLCPAISTIGPYDSDREVNAYIRRTNACPSLVRRMIRISRQIFTDDRDWDEHDPLRMIKKYKSPYKPKFYISIGWRDSFGFYEGAQRFQKTSALRKIFSLQWVPVPGPHCMFDRNTAADFIMED